MLNVRKHARLALPVGAALVAAAAVGGPALASTASTSSQKTAHAAATTRGKTGPRGPRGHTGARGPQGLQGPAGPSGSNGTNGANGTSGTAAGGGAEATILYAANVTTTANPGAVTPTVIYAGHGLAFSASCTSTSAGPTLALQAGAGDAIDVNGTQASPTPVIASGGTLNDYSSKLNSTPGGQNDVLFASTDGSVVELHFTTSASQTGANCFVYGVRVGG